MQTELSQILTTQTGAVIVCGIFAWYIKGRDANDRAREERDKKTHEGYIRAIAENTRAIEELRKSNDEKTAIYQSVYAQNFKLCKDVKEKDALIKSLNRRKTS